MSAFPLHNIFGQSPTSPDEERTSGVAWLTVLLGAPILVGNVAELGGVQPAAQEWTAWLFAALILVHGVGLAWRWRSEDAVLRLPRWPLWAFPLVLGLGVAWWRDDTNPLQSSQTFFLALEAWFLCWVVSATPGNRALSWAWLMVVVVAAGIALLIAVGWQVPAGGRWLPMARQLPAVWQGYWSGTLPWPAAFGALMLLAGPPLLVMAWSRHLPLSWRLLCCGIGLAMLMAAFHSLSIGVWFGAAYALVMLPWVAAGSRRGHCAGCMVAIVGLAWAGWLLYRMHNPNSSRFELLTQGGTPLDATRYALAEAWQHNPWLGGAGASVAELSRTSGLPQPEGGWSFGFSDWLELTVSWGIIGLGLVAIILGGLLSSAWASWARLPFAVETCAAEGEPTTEFSG
ncbi:MAG TPA: hypothetical protein VK737_10340, partial [Opitutales bacterium]|nr:hypothetical protein [Opitutales bacterium]